MLFLAYLKKEDVDYPFDIVSLTLESLRSHTLLQDALQERLIPNDGSFESIDGEVYFPLEFFVCS